MFLDEKFKKAINTKAQREDVLSIPPTYSFIIIQHLLAFVKDFCIFF